jgi:hypothetical protein
LRLLWSRFACLSSQEVNKAPIDSIYMNFMPRIRLD